MPIIILISLITLWVISPLSISESSLSERHLNLPLATVQAEEELIEAPLGLNLQAAYIKDLIENSTLSEYKADVVWPIASLTKLMAVLVVLDHTENLNMTVALHNNDMVEGSALRVPAGTRFYADDLFHAALISSANNATKALVRATGMNEEEFVRQMNIKAQEMGLTSTYFTEPTGLDPANVSTPREIAQMVKMAFDNDLIRRTINKPNHTLRPLNHPAFTINNTNRLLKENLEYEMLGGKTGFTYTSDFNFVAQFKKDDQQIMVVVFGDEGFLEAFDSAKKLAENVFSR